MRKVALILFLFPFCFSAQDFSVGSWREHLPYSNVTFVVPMGNKCYASTPYSLYFIDNEDNSVNRLSTINGLSELGVSIIHPNEDEQAIVVGYNSGNIDVIKNETVINISAIVNSNVIGDKRIYGMFSKNEFTYLATGFGIVVLDVKREEIKDTYFIGSGGSQIKINDITIGGGNIYAATDLGVFYASENASFLANPSSWNSLSVPLSSSSDFHLIEYVSDGISEKLVVVQQGDGYADDVAYVFEDNIWSSPTELTADDIYSLELKENNLLVTKNNNVVVYDGTFNQLEFLYTHSGNANLAPNFAVYKNGFFWLGDRKLGLLKVESNWNSQRFPISGPFTNEGVHLTCSENDLWVSAGRIDGSNWNNTYNWRGAFHFNQQDWSVINRTTQPELEDSLVVVTDFVWATIDPSDDQHVFLSSFRGGLIEIQNDQMVERYSFYNSSLQTRLNVNGNNVHVAATCFDNSGNLWVSNSFVSNPLSVLTPDGEWMSFSCGSQASDALCTDIFIDDIMGYIWLSVKNTGIVVYDYNQTPLDASDDRYRVLSSSTGQGGLPSSVVNTITQDQDGEIWIGTEQGPAVIYNLYNIFDGVEIDAQQILLNLDGSVQLLLENENISEILVDGGNRKWLATAGGGLFLMSEDGTQMIHSFNSQNSPLFSNNILSLAISGRTGELFIATEKGLMGYKGDATAPQLQFNDVYAYPNPVRPEYSGQIAIKGFMRDSEVKITDALGNLVFSTFSQGGQAIWSGKTLSGERVRSGVYYVFVTNVDGTQKSKTKILIMN